VAVELEVTVDLFAGATKWPPTLRAVVREDGVEERLQSVASSLLVCQCEGGVEAVPKSLKLDVIDWPDA
jgi:hypothetical protein